MSEAELHQQLVQAVLDLNVQQAGELSQLVLDQGYSARRAILEGLAEGMRQVGKKFSCQEYFVPEVLLAARAMYRGFNLLKPRILDEGAGASTNPAGRIAIAVVEGDLHDIGKNVVKLLLEAEGFEVQDLGKNVAAPAILNSLTEQPTSLLALSTLMTTTLMSMERTIVAVREQFPQMRIMVGGAPVTPAFAAQIGADGTASDAAGAVELASRLLSKK